MPWKVQSPMSVREEFVAFASQPDANVAALCRRFGVSRKTGYKWLARARAGGGGGGGAPLADRSRRPRTSPSRTSGDVEQLVVTLRQAHPAWGARKLKRRLEDLGHADLVPARSTVNGILARHGLIAPAASAAHAAIRRFERAAPNELWQMDFKGHVATGDGGRCHPLTVLDDHSRFNVLLRACADERLATVRDALADAMRRYGVPGAILSDNGPPWGSRGRDGNWTRLGAWLVRRGVRVLHGRPGHPQTQGKEERFHRTFKAEAIGARGGSPGRSPRSRGSTRGATSTTSSGRTRRWGWPRPRRGTRPRPGRSPRPRRRSSTARATRCARCAARGACGSKASGTGSASRSPASRSRCGRASARRRPTG